MRIELWLTAKNSTAELQLCQRFDWSIALRLRKAKTNCLLHSMHEKQALSDERKGRQAADESTGHHPPGAAHNKDMSISLKRNPCKYSQLIESLLYQSRQTLRQRILNLAMFIFQRLY